MEGLSAETCSLDGSRQTNYIQLLSLADGDSLTQPAYGNLTYFTAVPTTPVVVRKPNNYGIVRDILPKYTVSNAAVATPMPQSQLLLAYDLGDGRYAIGGNILASATSINLTSEITSTTSAFADVNNCCGEEESSSDESVHEQRRPPAPSFDTEAQLEAPSASSCVRKTTNVSIVTPPQSPRLVRGRATNRRKRKSNRLKNNGTSMVAGLPLDSEKGGWPKGKKRKRSHPRLKEPTAPVTAYVIYSRERRPILKIENSDISNAEITRMVGNEWTSLSKIEKQKYSQKAVNDLERYKNELREYQQSPEYQEFLKEKREKKGQLRSNAPSSSSPIRLDETSNNLATPSNTQFASALFCADCDLYFLNEHNKAEHMRSLKHRRNTVGAFEKYLAKTTPNCSCSADSKQKHEDLASNIPLWPLPEPLDVNDFIVQYAAKDEERNFELSELRKTVDDMNSKLAQKKLWLTKLAARHDTLKREIVQTKLRRIVCEQQLANLKAIPLLFETEDYLT